MIYSPQRELTPRNAKSGLFRGWYWRSAFIIWAVLSLAAFSLANAYINQFRQERVNAGFARANVAAEALEQTLLRSVEAIESIQSLTQTREDLVNGRDAAGATAISEYLKVITVQEKFGVMQISTIGADGWMTWSTTPFTERLWLGDREHFLVHKNGKLGMYVSQPLIGRASRRWSVQFTRPLFRPDGSFGGVTVISFDPLKLSNSLASLRFGEGSISVILSVPEGRLIARSEGAEQQLGRPANPNLPVLIAAQTSSAGTLRTVNSVTRRDSLQAYRLIGQLPLVVTVSLDAENELKDVQSVATWVNIALGAAVLLTAAIIGVIAQRSARQRSRMELELTRQEADAAEMARTQISRLVSGLPAAVYSMQVSPDGDVVRHEMAENVERLTGWRSDELRTREAWRSHAQDFSESDSLSYRRRVIQDGEAVVEYGFQRRDGSLIWLRDQARIVDQLPDGTVSMIGYVSDMTRERHIQEQAIATSKLATLGEMATGLAHELNQPIAIMSLAAENAQQMLERKGVGGIDFAVQRMGRITDQAKRARAIINHLRIFGRQTDEELGPITLAEVVDGALTLVGSALRSSNVTVGVILTGDLPPVLGQLVLAEQVIINLMLNARDAMEGNSPDRPKDLTINAALDEDMGTVALLIQDNGPGIPEAALSRLFEPFFTTKEVGKGTGLGLSICHGIMNSFGGTITAYNNPGGGAVFVATFRCAPVQAILDDQAMAASTVAQH